MYADIYAAIEAHITDTIGTDGVQLSNTFIEVGNRTWWARITHLPIEPGIATIGVGGLNARDGLTQVDIFTRPGTGRTSVPDQVVGIFTRTTQFSLSDGVVYNAIAYHESGDLVQDGYWQDRVIIRWSSHTTF